MSTDETKPLLPTGEQSGDVKLTRASMSLRWTVLILSCLLMIGNYYCYDNPAALSSELKQYFATTAYGGNWPVYFNLLYVVYSIPNTVLPFIGGFFVDYFGVRIMLVIYGSLILGGQLLFAFGLSLKSIPVMLAGRTVFGLGGENLTVAQSALVAVWFKDKELAFAMGLNLSIARLGGVINNFLSPIFWNHDHLSLWVGAMICGASLVCILVLVPLDKLAENRILKSNPSAAKITVDEKVSLKDARHFNKAFWLLTAACVIVYGCVLPFNNVASSFLTRRDYLDISFYTGNTSVPGNCESDCPGTYATYASCSFNNTLNCQTNETNTAACNGCQISSKYNLSNTWDASSCVSTPYCSALDDAITKSNTAMSIPYFISAAISPFLGYAVDRFGGRAVLATLSPFVLIFVHLSLGFTSITPIAPLVGQGLAYSVFAASLWPSVPKVVKEEYVGTAYGLMTAVQNAGMSIFPLIVGAVLNSCNNVPCVYGSTCLTKDQLNTCANSLDNFKYSETMFACLGCVGVSIGIGLIMWDRKNGHVLNNGFNAAKSALTTVN